MRIVVLTTIMALAAVPAFAQSTNPGPASQYQREQATQSFSNAGHATGHAARDTWHGVKHGFQASKQSVKSGWNRVTGDNARTTSEANR